MAEDTSAGVPDPSVTRCGFVVLVGRPNAGKSTLLNAWLGTKVAIVTPKPQTTRTRIQGVIHRPGVQVIVVDTPGYYEGKSALHRAMRGTLTAAANDSDVALAIIDASHPKALEVDQRILEIAKRCPGKVTVALNKIDRVRPRQQLLPIMQAYAAAADFAGIVPVSARSGDGLDELLSVVAETLPEGPAVFAGEQYTDQVERALVAEMVREAVLLQTHQEVPHGVAVQIESFEDMRGEGDGDGLCRIEGRIYVERDSQKGIVVGKGGQRIKSVSESARKEAEAMLGCKVYLRLTVHVDRDWTANAARVRLHGLAES